MLESVTRDLQWVGWLLVSQLVLLLTAVFLAEFGPPRLAEPAFALYWMAHLLACLLLGIAARRLGASGLLYGLLPLAVPLGGPLGSLIWLKILQHAGAGPGPAPLVTIGSKMTPMQYLVIIERSENGFGAYVPDLPGCIAAGESREEVVALIQEAIEFHIDGLKRSGNAVPEPSSQGELVDVHAA